MMWTNLACIYLTGLVCIGTSFLVMNLNNPKVTVFLIFGSFVLWPFALFAFIGLLLGFYDE
jgi:hypothetical protein